MSSQEEEQKILMGNEFAKLRVTLRHVGNGMRLEVADVVTGASTLLDPLELLGLAWSDEAEREPLVNPSTMSRWRE
jgi:hypothetical protein